MRSQRRGPSRGVPRRSARRACRRPAGPFRRWSCARPLPLRRPWWTRTPPHLVLGRLTTNSCRSRRYPRRRRAHRQGRLRVTSLLPSTACRLGHSLRLLRHLPSRPRRRPWPRPRSPAARRRPWPRPRSPAARGRARGGARARRRPRRGRRRRRPPGRGRAPPRAGGPRRLKRSRGPKPRTWQPSRRCRVVRSWPNCARWPRRSRCAVRRPSPRWK